MSLFEKIQKGTAPYTNPAMGQFYIEELNLTTPWAPLPDRDESGIGYWNHTGFHHYNTAIIKTTIDCIEKQLEKNGMKSLHPYPPLPPIPVPDIVLDGNSYYNIESMIKHAKFLVRRFIAYAVEETSKPTSPDAVDQKSDASGYQVPCGNKLWGIPGECRPGLLCDACEEVLRLRNVIDDMMSVKDGSGVAMAAAQGRISAVVRDLTSVEFLTGDPKYVIISGKICNAATREPIPDDEPIFILRAKDAFASSSVFNYADNLCHGTQHREAVLEIAQKFVNFRKEHPDLMKRPDTVA